MKESVRPLTVLQVIPDLGVGGAERTTVDVAAALVAAGGRALVASAGGRLVAELEAAGATHIALRVGTKNPLLMAVNAVRLARIVRGEAVDIVHARSRAPAWSALPAARRARVPFVTTYHGAYGQRSRAKAVYNSVMARGDVVIANSVYTARLIAERHPAAAGRTVVIPRGIDMAAFAAADLAERAAALRQAWRIAPTDRLIVQLARLTRWKGQGVLVDALGRLDARGVGGWSAVLAGDPQGREDYREELAGAIAAAGLASQVTMTGPATDPVATMAAADVVVVASIEPEAFGRAAVEAQAAGKPVIVSDLGAVAETVLSPPRVADEERTGWRVAAGDPAALADALAAVLAMPAAAREAIGARGRRHAAAHFSLKRMQSATLDVYRALSGR